MQVMNVENSAVFRGEDDEILNLRAFFPKEAPGTLSVELFLTTDDYAFCARLDEHEVDQLIAFLGFKYGDAESQLLKLGDPEAEHLVFRHSNKGEPYREGVDIIVEGSDSYPDYRGPFIETRDANEMRRYLQKNRQL